MNSKLSVIIIEDSEFDAIIMAEVLEQGRVAYLSQEGDVTELPGKGRDVIPAGCRLVMDTPGGGGLGSPESRAQTLLESDKVNGLVDE